MYYNYYNYIIHKPLFTETIDNRQKKKTDNIILYYIILYYIILYYIIIIICISIGLIISDERNRIYTVT